MNATEKATSKIIPYIKAIKHGSLPGPISLHILITDRCVNKCNMCGHWKTKDKKELSIETIEKLFNEANKIGVESICLTGGDPTIHKNFSDILKIKRNFELGIVSTGNFSEGFDFSLLKDLAFIRFSLDSIYQDVYEKIRGRKNIYEILNNIEISSEFNSNVGINFTVQKLNYRDLIPTFHVFENSKVNLKRFIAYPVHGNESLSLSQYEKEILYTDLKLRRHSWNKIPENNIEFLMKYLKGEEEILEKPTSERPCIINKIHLAINAAGQVFPCETIADDTDIQGERDVVIGSIYVDSLKEIWQRNYDKTFTSEKCQICFSRYLPINKTYHDLKDKKIFI